MPEIDFPTDLDSWASQVALLEDRWAVARGEPGLELDLAAARMGLGRALLEAGQPEQAKLKTNQARTTYAAWVDAGHVDLEHHLLTCELDLASAARVLGQTEDSLAAFGRARALIEQWPTDGGSDRDLNLALCDLHGGQRLAELGRRDEAVAWLERARPVLERRLEAGDGDAQLDLASLSSTLGALHLKAGRLAEAQAACRRGAELIEPFARDADGGEVFEGLLLSLWLDQARALVFANAFAEADNVLGWAAELLPHHRRLARVGGRLYGVMLQVHDAPGLALDLSRDEVIEGAEDLLAAVLEAQRETWQAELWRAQHLGAIARDLDGAAAVLEVAAARHRHAEPRLALALADLLAVGRRPDDALAAARRGAGAARALLEDAEAPARVQLSQTLLALVELASDAASGDGAPAPWRDETRRELLGWLAPLEAPPDLPDDVARRVREVAAALREGRPPEPIVTLDGPWWARLFDLA